MFVHGSKQVNQTTTSRKYNQNAYPPTFGVRLTLIIQFYKMNPGI